VAVVADNPTRKTNFSQNLRFNLTIDPRFDAGTLAGAEELAWVLKKGGHLFRVLGLSIQIVLSNE
jgi:hypothetical protein